jgi:hypothetical protein
MSEEVDIGTAKIDLEKYTELVLKVEEAEDKIREMEQLTHDLKKTTALAKPPERFSFGSLFRDENDINEKSIIGFASFTIMVVFGLCDLVTGIMGNDLNISDTIYASFVIVTLGSFGISEAGKAFSK